MNRLWIVVVLCLLVSGIVVAQDSDLITDIPLIAVFNGQIYRMEGDALVAYDACMPDEDLSVQFSAAPDGTKFAFATLPKIFSTAIGEFGSLGDMPPSTNLWLCDTSSDTLIRIHAIEGADAPFEGEVPDAAPITSVPEWSPDGDLLAWTSVSPDGNEYALWIYDIANDEKMAYPLDLPPPFMFPLPPMLYWGAENLYMTLLAFNEETFVAEETLYTYDFESNDFSNTVILLSEGESSDFITDRMMTNRGGRDEFAIHLFEGGWIIVNPTTGEQTVIEGVLLAYGQNGLTGLNVLADVDENFNFNWQVVSSNAPFVLESYPLHRIAFAPDGVQMAFADSTLHIWFGGDVRDIANSDGFADDVFARVLWGRTNWTSAIGGAVASAPLPTCESTQLSRLHEGDSARVVSEGTSNRLRANPSTAAEQIGQIPAGEGFIVLEGPVCADGYAWYRVQYLDTQGWTAEGSADQYFLEPIGE
ncbi:MAG: SH3 domain-containing protein [Anaerolineae bacterium]|nr:SH3 domain-containing protein [Anaerolineae bacterium]